MELSWKLQTEVLSAQKNLLDYGVLYIPAMPVCIALFGLLGMQQALVLLDLLDLLSANNATLNPVQYIYRHPSRSSIYYMCWI